MQVWQIILSEVLVGHPLTKCKGSSINNAKHQNENEVQSKDLKIDIEIKLEVNNWNDKGNPNL